MTGDIFKATGSYMPPPPDYASPPILWGREDARAMLGDRFGELRDQVVAIWRRANEATDGTLRLPQEYLPSIIRL